MSCNIAVCDCDLLLWTKFVMKWEKVQGLKLSKMRQIKANRSLTSKMEIGRQRFKRESTDMKWYKTLKITRGNSEESNLALFRISLHYRAPKADFCLHQVQLPGWEKSTGCLQRVVRIHINVKTVACWS